MLLHHRSRLRVANAMASADELTVDLESGLATRKAKDVHGGSILVIKQPHLFHQL